MNSKENKETTRVNLYLNNELVAKLDEFSKKRGLNRSSGLSVLLFEFFEQKDSLNTLSQFTPYLHLLKTKNPDQEEVMDLAKNFFPLLEEEKTSN